MSDEGELSLSGVINPTRVAINLPPVQIAAPEKLRPVLLPRNTYTKLIFCSDSTDVGNLPIAVSELLWRIVDDINFDDNM